MIKYLLVDLDKQIAWNVRTVPSMFIWRISSNFRWGYGGFDSSGGGRKSDRTCSRSNRKICPCLTPRRMPCCCHEKTVRSLTPWNWATSRVDREPRPFRSIACGAKTGWRTLCFTGHRLWVLGSANFRLIHARSELQFSATP